MTRDIGFSKGDEANHPFFSIAMAVYDGVNIDELNDAISSIFDQDFINYEVILVSDGVRRPDILACLNKVVESDSRFRLAYSDLNLGLANAMNIAIGLMQSEWLVRMDSDDISRSDRLSKVYNYILENQDIDVIGSYIYEFNKEKTKPKRLIKYALQHDDILAQFRRRNSIAHASAFIRKSFFDCAGKYPVISIRNEDTLLWLAGFMTGAKYANLPLPLYSARFNESTASRRISLRKTFSDFIDRLRVIVDLRGGLADYICAVSVFFLSLTPFYMTVRSFLFRLNRTEGS